MTMPKLRHLATILGCALALAVGGLTTAASASAATADAGQSLSAQRAVFVHLLDAPNPAAAYQALSASDKALANEAVQHQQVTVVASETGRMSTADVKAAVAAGELSPAAVSPNAGGCWWKYADWGWSNLGVTEGYTWMQLNWCSNGPSITSWHVSNVGGQGQNGVSYEGYKGPYSLNAGWEIRAAIQYAFNFHFFTANPCLQIRGGHTGLYSVLGSCNLG